MPDSNNIKLYWCPQTRAQRVIWMLEEAALDYDPVVIDIRDPDRTPDTEFLSASPMGKVPAIIDGDVKLSESAAICLYLADKYPANKLAPSTDSSLRGQYLYWMLYTPAVVEPAMAEKFAGREPNTVQNGWGSFDLMIAAFEAALKNGPWILGDTFSAADVMVGSSACFMQQFGMLGDSEVLKAYADRCMKRPAYKKSITINDAA
ncbi:glutathione S-transferase family protein [Kordiimonas aquimaris]|uniref:glutathione S-transferase family protein n=1 Tax=Kordiimonas aquimaris TaxID=707591 RepID=UPI0021CFE60D|nr:glutathione S-transferase family protein [Kordiimonas aquimaris]